MRQPALRPLFQTRSVIESLQAWSRVPAGRLSAVEAVRERMRAEAFPRAATPGEGFEAFWERTLQAGFVRLPPAAASAPALRPAALAPLLTASATAHGELELWLHPSHALRDGRGANNGWLQELPDPITKVTWDNVACVAPSRAKQLGWTDGQLVELSAGGRKVTVPVVVQPGTHPRVVAVALGYGRTGAGAVGNGVGADAYPLSELRAGRVRFARPVEVRAAGGSRPLALSQIQSSLEGRPMVREATLTAFLANPAAGNPEEEPLESAWGEHPVPGPNWGLAVDLTACTGCGACVVACQAENNIPVVGRGRGAPQPRDALDAHRPLLRRRRPTSPEVLHQPMMCQHCDNAPCETVCPVLATVHSRRGAQPAGLQPLRRHPLLRQQLPATRCGASTGSTTATTTRSRGWCSTPTWSCARRGVMEKCTLCVQRIQEAKAEAQRDGRAARRRRRRAPPASRAARPRPSCSAT